MAQSEREKGLCFELLIKPLGLRGYFKGCSYDVFAAWPLNRPQDFPGDSLQTGFNVTYQF